MPEGVSPWGLLLCGGRCQVTRKQFHFLKPGDRVRRKGDMRIWIVTGVVVYLTKHDQVVDAVQLGATMYQRHEMLRGFEVIE